MNIPFDGWANSISIQLEDVFNGASAQPVYNLAGKTKFTQKTTFGDKRETVDVWRNQTGNVLNTRFYSGSIELEFGFNAVIQLLLAGFFEVESSTDLGGGLTQYNFRPARLQSVKSYKIGMSFNGEKFWTYSGLVIDSLTLAIRRNQIPLLIIAYKAAIQNQDADSALLGTPSDVEKNITNHTQFSMTLDDEALPSLTEANLIFTQTKKPARFNSAGYAQKFGGGGFKKRDGDSFGVNQDNNMLLLLVGMNIDNLAWDVRDGGWVLGGALLEDFFHAR